MTALAFPRRRTVAADFVLRTAARGAILVGVAVVVGIVLLQVIDKGGSGGGGAVPTPSGGQTNGPTTSTTSDEGRPPGEVRVLVENGSGLSQAAATLANELRGTGYAIAGTGNAAIQTGTTVACRAGFEKEADALVQSLGAGVNAAEFPATPPTGAENADCIVIKGS
ncbi:MAG: LytR C-terminal domain-containing protein [Acidimicrobiia bacterium]|nr:LytR C-terminal domain-containing protein [Acidimicrobiia bacterium]